MLPRNETSVRLGIPNHNRKLEFTRVDDNLSRKQRASLQLISAPCCEWGTENRSATVGVSKSVVEVGKLVF